MLTNREYDVLKIIYDSEKPLIASEVTTKMEGLTINTVQAVLKKLLRTEIIEVAEIVYSGTVLSRSYKVGKNAPAIIAKDFANEIKKYDGFVDYDKLIAALEKQRDKAKKA